MQSKSGSVAIIYALGIAEEGKEVCNDSLHGHEGVNLAESSQCATTHLLCSLYGLTHGVDEGLEEVFHLCHS